MYLESFEIVTERSKTRLPLDGTLTGWTDEVTHRLVEHVILNRDGSLHQSRGQGAKQHTFRCLLRDPGATDRYKEIEALLGAEVFGTLIHPRFGRLPFAFVNLKVSEDLGQTVNGLMVDLSVAETGLRTIAAETASGAARQAGAASQTLKTQAVGSALATKADAVDAAAIAFITAVESGAASQVDLSSGLKALGDAVDTFVGTAGVDVGLYALVANARLAYGHALRAYQLSGAVRAMRTVTIDARMSLHRLVQGVYGGGAAALIDEILLLNHVPNPYALPVGTRLLIPDPASVRL